MSNKKKNVNAAGINLHDKAGNAYEVPPEGSLGLMALGYVGLMAWRERRSAYLEQKRQEIMSTEKDNE